MTVKMAWDLDDASFISVDAVILLAMPLFSRDVHSCFVVTISAFRPVTLIAPFFASEIFKFFVLCPDLGSKAVVSSKSLISSP